MVEIEDARRVRREVGRGTLYVHHTRIGVKSSTEMKIILTYNVMIFD